MVDEPRLRTMLQRIADDLGYLDARAGEDRTALVRDDERLSGLKYRFVTAIEGIINVAQHLCASQGWGPPDDNGHAVRLLGRNGRVLDADTSVQVARAVAFRNLLVHRYADVDDERVVGMLDQLDHLHAFLDQSSAWVLAQRD